MAKVKKTSSRRPVIPYASKEDDPSLISIIIWMCVPIPPITQIVSLVLIAKKLRNVWQRKRFSSFRNYANIIGDRSAVDVKELSAKTGRPVSTVYADLQTMIEEGYFGEYAYVDRSRRLLILDDSELEFEEDIKWKPSKRSRGKQEPMDLGIDLDTVRETVEMVRDRVVPVGTAVAKNVYNAIEKSIREAKIIGMDRSADRDTDIYEEAEEAPAQEPEPKPVEVEQELQEDRFESMLKQIKNLNDQIDDEGVSRRIDRIGELTASIFSVVRQKPEHNNEVQKFMNYYLPTTFKLLKSYALMEKQSYQGENITASRKKIEDILDLLITGYEQQQDRLFTTEALDVDTDIQVLETMMAKDGLVYRKGTNMRASAGNGK